MDRLMDNIVFGDIISGLLSLDIAKDLALETDKLYSPRIFLLY